MITTMRYRKLLAPDLFTFALALACGAGGCSGPGESASGDDSGGHGGESGGESGIGGGGGSGGQDGTVSPDVIGIVASPVTQTRVVGTFDSAVGKRFALVPITLTNGSTDAIPLAMTFFSVDTSASLQTIADLASIATSAPCPEDSLLRPGGTYSCTLAFELPDGQDPIHLNYSTQTGLEGGADLTMVPCEWCEVEECVDLSKSAAHCGACYNNVPKCANGMPECEGSFASCPDNPGTCTDLTSDRDNCGGCNAVCPTSMPEIFSCFGDRSDACRGNSCGCFGGQCAVVFPSAQQATCDSVCSSHGFKCKSSTWAYLGGGQCLGGDCSEVPPDRHNGYDFFGQNCHCVK